MLIHSDCLVSPRLYDSVQTFSVGQVSALSDHCPIKAVLSVILSTEKHHENYNYIDSPKKLPWSTDIAMRLENILQTPEYRSKVEKLFFSQNVSSQEEVDNMAEMLTNILVEGTLLANSPHTKEVTRMEKKKKVKNKKFRHPKWHDLSCEDAYRKVAVSARLLKNSPKIIS